MSGIMFACHRRHYQLMLFLVVITVVPLTKTPITNLTTQSSSPSKTAKTSDKFLTLHIRVLQLLERIFANLEQ